MGNCTYNEGGVACSQPAKPFSQFCEAHIKMGTPMAVVSQDPQVDFKGVYSVDHRTPVQSDGQGQDGGGKDVLK